MLSTKRRRRPVLQAPGIVLLDREIAGQALRVALRKLDPRTLIRNPGDVRRRGRGRARDAWSSSATSSPALPDTAADRPDRRLALVHGAVRELRRGGGRGPGQGAAPTACARRAPGDARPSAWPRWTRAATRWCRSHRLRHGRRRAGRGRRHHPRRRRGDRGHRARSNEVGDHRRVGAGHPRERRRPLGGHRRHAGRVRLAQGAGDRRARARASSTA